MRAKEGAAPGAAERAGEEERGRLGGLYRRHAPDALRLAMLLTGDRALAEDLVQEGFARVVGRLAHLRDPDAFAGYLRKTVVNLARMHFRRRKVERAFLEGERARPASPPDGPDVETRQAVMAALLQLPERQRAAIVLRFYEDLSERQAAEVLGCRPGTVSSLVSRGLESLRPLIRRD